MKAALCLGGADCLASDLAAALDLVTPDLIVACNDAGTVVERVDAWATLHSENLPRWISERKANGFGGVPPLYSHMIQIKAGGLPITVTDWRMPGLPETASSGIYAAKVALYDLGCDRAILCGVPMTSTPHFFDAEDWPPAQRYLDRLARLNDDDKTRIRSMSGATAELLGWPTADWLT